MSRKIWLTLAAALVLGVLLFALGCSDSNTTNNPLPGTLTLTAPAVGDNWIVGTSRNITWTEQNVGSVDLAYSTNGGTNWISIATAVENVTSHPWTIPNTPSATCKVRVRDTADSTVSSTSGTFSISLPALVGTWTARVSATDSSVFFIADSMRYVFALDSAYTATQWVSTTDILETGDYLNLTSVSTDSIRFHVTSYDGTPVTGDSTYTRKYSLPTATTMNIQVFGLTEDLARDTLYTVIFHKQ
jgi:hypothetical protein